MDTSQITRIEVIDQEGRQYVGRDKEIMVSIQDDGKTLKIFVNDR